MIKQIMAIIMCLSGLNASAMEEIPLPSATVLTFEPERDTQAVIALLNANKELIQRPGLSVEELVKTRSLTPNKPETHGSLIIKVLYDQAAQKEENKFKAFGAYTRTKEGNNTVVHGALIATKEGDQSEGYAELLMRSEIDALLKEDVAKFWAQSRDFMTRAHALYRKIARNYPQFNFIERRATAQEVGNPDITDVRVFELHKK